MKLLFDANLSPALVGRLRAEYADSVHVRDVGLRNGSDAEIWDYAKKNGFVIASKDTDFRERSFVQDPPPKVIWLDAGNAGTREIELLSRTAASRTVRTGTGHFSAHFVDRAQRGLTSACC